MKSVLSELLIAAFLTSCSSVDVAGRYPLTAADVAEIRQLASPYRLRLRPAFRIVADRAAHAQVLIGHPENYYPLLVAKQRGHWKIEAKEHEIIVVTGAR
jgi:hypothetical protein